MSAPRAPVWASLLIALVREGSISGSGPTCCGADSVGAGVVAGSAPVVATGVSTELSATAVRSAADVAFLVAVFLAGAFLAAVFLAGAFFAGAFFTGGPIGS